MVQQWAAAVNEDRAHLLLGLGVTVVPATAIYFTLVALFGWSSLGWWPPAILTAFTFGALTPLFVHWLFVRHVQRHVVDRPSTRIVEP